MFVTSFIGKFHALRQEFGFSSPQVFLKLINIYGTSFYGSVLWDLGGTAADSLFASWNSFVRMTWNLPNTTHRYLIEEVSEFSHIQAILSQRYLGFMHSLINSKKKCLSELARKMIFDQGSNSGQNINLIALSAGYTRYNVMKMSPSCVANAIKYCPVPKESKWKIAFLKELMSVRDGDLRVGDDEEDGFTKEEISHLIGMVATQ